MKRHNQKAMFLVSDVTNKKNGPTEAGPGLQWYNPNLAKLLYHCSPEKSIIQGIFMPKIKEANNGIY